MGEDTGGKFFAQREVRSLQALDVPPLAVGNGSHDVHELDVHPELGGHNSNQ